MKTALLLTALSLGLTGCAGWCGPNGPAGYPNNGLVCVDYNRAHNLTPVAFVEPDDMLGDAYFDSVNQIWLFDGAPILWPFYMSYGHIYVHSGVTYTHRGRTFVSGHGGGSHGHAPAHHSSSKPHK